VLSDVLLPLSEDARDLGHADQLVALGIFQRRLGEQARRCHEFDPDDSATFVEVDREVIDRRQRFSDSPGVAKCNVGRVGLRTVCRDDLQLRLRVGRGVTVITKSSPFSGRYKTHRFFRLRTGA
jgi:hypothetical protein